MTPGSCGHPRHATLRGVARSIGTDVTRWARRSREDEHLEPRTKDRLSAFLTPSLLALAAHRVSHYFWVGGFRRIATAIARINQFVHKAAIAPASCIGDACFLPHPAGVTFYGRAGANLTLYSMAICTPDAASLSGPVDEWPLLDDDVTLGAHVVATGRVHLGSRVRAAFGVRFDHDLEGPAVVLPRGPRKITPRGDTR